MRSLTVVLAAIVALAFAQPQDPPEKKTVYPDPHSKDNRDRFKTYPELVKESAPKHDKVARFKADLKYTGSEPYNDDPINYEGFVVYSKDKDSTDCYMELGRLNNKKLEPMIRVYQNDTTLTVVDEEYLTYS